MFAGFFDMTHIGLRNPYKIGVTGGIGSGKSVVSRLLRLMGIPVYDCDSEAKRLMCCSSAVRNALIAAVGSEVYRVDGTLDRAFLSAYMFGYPERVAQVNAIVHPAVRADFEEWARLSDKAVVAVESAILFEAGMDADVDAVWLVCAPESLRLQRAVLRDGSHYLRTEMELTGVDDVDMYNIIPLIYNVDTKTAGSAPVSIGNTRGAVLMSNKIFAGLETLQPITP